MRASKINSKKYAGINGKAIGILTGLTVISLLTLHLGFSSALADVNTLANRPTLTIQAVECDHDLEERVGLSWNSVPSAKKYEVFRNQPDDAGWTSIAVDIAGKSFIDYDLTGGAGTYQYQIMASAANGATSYSDIKSAQVPDCRNPYAPGQEPLDDPILSPVPDPSPSLVPSVEPEPADDVGISNLILNPSLETASTNGDPEYWLRGGWGSNVRVFTYPVAGTDGADAAKVEITSHTSGDAKWYFEDIAVEGGQTYNFSHSYKSTTPSQLVIRYKSGNEYSYYLASKLSASSSWSASNLNITPPPGVTSMTIFHLLSSIGWLMVDNYQLANNSGSGVPNTPSPNPADDPNFVDPGLKYVMLNAITWGERPLQDLPLRDISEATYFVVETDGLGNLVGGNPSLETSFVDEVHAAGKKATLSVGGGAQNIANIELALVTNKARLIQSIASRIRNIGYDGVILDVENTNLPASAMPEFIAALRVALGPEPIIGLYVQPWQSETVWRRLGEVASQLTWVAPMIYDFEYNMGELKSLTLQWLPKLNGNRSKLLAGVAVNYPTGLDATEYKSVLQWISSQGLGGVGIWQNKLFDQPWIDAQRQVWPEIQ